MAESQKPAVKRGSTFQDGKITVLSICNDGVIIDHVSNQNPIQVSHSVIERLYDAENEK